MKDLAQGQKINLEGGGYVTVLQKLGEGGQGAVYRVKDSANNQEYALKWYIDPIIINNADFYRNLKDNVRLGAPADNFIWPLKVTSRQLGSYGYVMELRPQGFHEFGHFFRTSLYPDAKFAHHQAQLRAALGIVNGFRNLHAHGFSYKDLNDGNFFINPRTGSVLICDNDNVTANNIKGLIGGKARYMAPEIVAGGAPDINSDLLSMAFILYRIFMIDHPLEGKRTMVACLTDEIQKKVYGSEMVFCWDKDTDINRPDKDNHTNSLYNWSHAPVELRTMFTKALSQQAMHNPKLRVRDIEWKKLLLQLRAWAIKCPSGDHDVIANLQTNQCPRCGAKIDMSRIPKIEFPEYNYAITPKKLLYLGDSLKAIGRGIIHEGKNGKEIGLQNISGGPWTLQTAAGRIIPIPDKETFPLRPGMSILFNGTTRCKVI